MLTDLLKHIEEFSDPVEFERLCCDVLTAMGYLGIDPQGVGRKDGGKDALLRHPAFGRIVFHFSLRIDWRKKIEEDIETVKSSGRKYDQFVFVSNRKITAGEKDSLKLLCRQRINCELEIFDQERLRIILSSEKALCARYFPDYFVAGTVLDRLVSSVEKLVDQGLQIPKTERLQHAPRFLLDSIIEASNLATDNQIEEVDRKTTEIAKIVSSLSNMAAEGLFLIGCISHKEGRFESALGVWKKVLSINPEHYGSNFNLAVQTEYNSAGRRYGYGFRAEEAIEYYEKALLNAASPEERADCLDNKGVVLFKTKRFKEAKQCYIEAQKECPTHLSSRMNLITVLDSDGTETELELYQSLLNTELKDKALINMSAVLIRSNKWRDALLCLYHSKGRCRYIESNIQLSQIAYARGQYKKARMYAERAITQDPDNAEANYLLGIAHKAENNYESAEICFGRAIELYPSWLEPYLELAGTLERKNTPKPPERYFEVLKKILEINPNTKNIHNKLGNAYLEFNMFASARVEYEKELQIDQNNELPYFNLGLVAEYGYDGIRYSSKSAVEEAIAYYREALRCNPEYFPALFNMGTDLVIISSYTEAIEVLEKALKVSPLNDEVLTNLGIVYWKTGRIMEGLNCVQQASDINPKNHYARRLSIEIISGFLKPKVPPF